MFASLAVSFLMKTLKYVVPCAFHLELILPLYGTKNDQNIFILVHLCSVTFLGEQILHIKMELKHIKIILT